MKLTLLRDRLAVCRLAPDGEPPAWAAAGDGFRSLTRTARELSVVCAQDAVPEGVACEPGWRIFEVEGPLDFALTGVLASIAMPLAEARISIFALSTYDTDYVMVREGDVGRAVRALEGSGHEVAE